MQLAQEFSQLDIIDLTLDSRAVKPGYAFIALNNGVNFIPQAIENGAAVIIIDHTIDYKTDVPIIKIENLPQNYGKIASEFYGEPSKQLTIIGITGTNGKTSISHYIAELLQLNNKPCGIIGTLGVGEIDNLNHTGLTTPDAITVHKTLKQFVEQGIDYVAMEVSSHALAQGRVQGVAFDYAIFNNLSHDHLDYHDTMENYFAAKKCLFTDYEIKSAIINIDDDYGQQLAAELPNVVSYAIANIQAQVKADNIHYSATGITADITSPWGEAEIRLNLIGEFNLINVLASISAVAQCGVDFDKILLAASQLHAVAGRMQCFQADNKPLAIVDYAHTPDALAKALQAAKQHCSGKLWCVFGCGGDRDRAKRAEMAQMAEQFADHIIVTNDNPRHEDPDQIITDIQQGFSDVQPIVEPDRATAIAYAIEHAQANDTILIAGKGHEDYQQIGDEKLPFSDIEQIHARYCQ